MCTFVPRLVTLAIAGVLTGCSGGSTVEPVNELGVASNGEPARVTGVVPAGADPGYDWTPAFIPLGGRILFRQWGPTRDGPLLLMFRYSEPVSVEHPSCAAVTPAEVAFPQDVAALDWPSAAIASTRTGTQEEWRYFRCSGTEFLALEPRKQNVVLYWLLPSDTK
jgi:hypothetical protein